MKTYTIGIAGSTAHTVMCAQALLDDSHFFVEWVLTPPPQPLGRKHLITPNPLEEWALKHSIPIKYVDKKITPELKNEFSRQPDFLLVVDFGYLIPEWLLKFPKVAPINVHPSKLPRWRGSSPGQFVLLHGEADSALTIMIMDKGLDTGPILWQGELSVAPEMSLSEYYLKGFKLAQEKLPQTMIDLAEGELVATPQPAESPTVVARRLEKNDGYIPWSLLAPLIGKEVDESKTAELPPEVPQALSPLLIEVQKRTGEAWPVIIQHATQALTPWPGVWTMMPTEQGWKRLKIFSLKLRENNLKILLDQVQVEGKNRSHWKKN